MSRWIIMIKLSFLNTTNTYRQKYCQLQINTTYRVRLPAFEANRMRELEHAESVKLGSEELSTFSFSALSDDNDDDSTSILLQPAGPEKVTMTKNAAVSDMLMGPPMESTFEEPPGAVTCVMTMRKSPTRSPRKNKPKNKKAQQKRTKAAQVKDGPAQVANDLIPA
jgi:hypothetical protein